MAYACPAPAAKLRQGITLTKYCLYLPLSLTSKEGKLAHGHKVMLHTFGSWEHLRKYSVLCQLELFSRQKSLGKDDVKSHH